MAFGALRGVRLQRAARDAHARRRDCSRWSRRPRSRSSLDVVLWRPLRGQRAGFMSLFLASIGLALVLRQALLLVVRAAAAGLPRRPVQGLRDRQRPPVAGAGRHDRRRRPSRSSLRRALPRADDARPHDARARRRPRARRDRGHRRRPRDRAHVDPLRAPRRGSPACSPGSCRRRSTRTSASSSCSRSSPRSCSAGSAAPTARSPAGCCSGSRWSSRRGRRFSAASTPSTSRSSRSSCSIAALLVRPQGLFGRARVV